MENYQDNYLDFAYQTKREICPTEMSAQMEAFIFENYVQYQNKELRMQFAFNNEKEYVFINVKNEATGERNQHLYEGVTEFDCCRPSFTGMSNKHEVYFVFHSSERMKEIPAYFEGETIGNYGGEIEYLYDKERDMIIKQETEMIEAYGGYDPIGNQSETEIQSNTTITVYYGVTITQRF